MKIGIIGAGQIGAGVARKFSAAGHTVLLANSRGPETIKDVAEEVGATAVTAAEAIKDVDAIVLSIPLAKIPLLPAGFFAEVPADVPVIDTSNYYPFRDGQIAALDNGQVESLWVSEQIGRPIVKAWNNVLATTLKKKALLKGAEGRIALSVAGNDAGGKKIGMELVEVTGFDAIDGGTLAESWRQQPGNPGYCPDLDAEDLSRALAAADRSKALKNRGLLIERLAAMNWNVTEQESLDIHRELNLAGFPNKIQG